MHKVIVLGFLCLLSLGALSVDAFAQTPTPEKDLYYPCAKMMYRLNCAAYELGFELGKEDRAQHRSSSYDRHLDKYGKNDEESFSAGYNMGWNGYHVLVKEQENGYALSLHLNAQASRCDEELGKLFPKILEETTFTENNVRNAEGSAIVGVVSVWGKGAKNFRCIFSNSGAFLRVALDEPMASPDATVAEDKSIMDALNKPQRKHQ